LITTIGAAHSAEAKRAAPTDPGAQTCELQWDASFGKVELKQSLSGSGRLTREDLRIVRDIPSSGNWGSISLSTSLWTGSGTIATETYYLSLTGTYRKGKDQRLIVAMPDGTPLVIAMEYGATTIPVSADQIERMIAAGKPLTYRMVRVDRKGQEKALLSEGWLDMSGFAGLPLAGLPASAAHARAVLEEARGGTYPPCAMDYAAEMNSMASDEPVRKWLSFDCSEEWGGAQGQFTLRESAFTWTPRPREGLELRFSANFRVAPQPDLQGFIDAPTDAMRYGQAWARFDPAKWSENFKSNDPALRERQFAEMRRGPYVVRKTLAQRGETGFFWSEVSQVLRGDGDLHFVATDQVTGVTLERVLPWSEVQAADAELRAGQTRLQDRERDPLKRCKVRVEEELGGEEIIVT
jgi:hypothetical protein